MRALLIILLFATFNSISYSQAKKSIYDVRNVYDEKGDYYFDRTNYKKAIVYYNMAYSDDPSNYYSVLRRAETYKKMGLFDQAAECYRIIFETSLHIPNEHRLDFALLLLKNKDITGFERWMEKYNEVVRSEIEGFITSSEVRAKMYKDSSFVLVENESILNSSESEIPSAVYKDRVVFASTRKNLAANIGNGFYNMFSARFLGDGHLGRLNEFNTSLNTSKSESSVFISDKKNSMYFSRGTSPKSGLQAFETKIPSGKNDALSIKSLSVGGMKSIGHVAFNSSGTKMYFVSDAPGGSGGLDIYYSELSGGKWGKPKNLGPKINSPKDEMYPFVLNDTLLFFSSEGHKGLGGLDLYSVSLNRGNASPKNLGNKVNSKYDDFGLTFSSGGYTGYFSSDRPGGFGKEDIYRLHLIDLKVKYAAYRFKRRTTLKEDKINLQLSDGKDYNIASKGKAGFDFGFEPQKGYKLVIQHENPLASNIIYNKKLTGDQKKKKFLDPAPFQKTEIKLQPGMRYQFTAGMEPISSSYKNELKEMSKDYQGGGNTIDFTALAKELHLKKGEIYTIRFVKDNNQPVDSKSKEEGKLYVNGESVVVGGRNFFLLLPLDVQANFNIKTDISHFKDNFNPKKTGKVAIDQKPVYKEETIVLSEGFPILINTAFANETSREIEAKELAIIPGSMYILTLTRTDKGNGSAPELVVPLTKGVKYDLGAEGQSQKAYSKALSQMAANTKSSGELIDISVLSKELDIASEKNIVFNLIPAMQLPSQESNTRSVLTTLDVDGRKFYVTNRQKFRVKLQLEQNKRVNLQTDLDYVKENFDPSTISITADTTAFSKDVITDPVFDIVVVNFNLNDYSIRPDAKSILADKVIQILKGDSRLYVTIKGYSDPLGDAGYNKKLSKNRALAVKDFLSRNGIGEKRIRTFSFGESQLLKSGVNWKDLSEEELKKHRKVEIVIYLPK